MSQQHVGTVTAVNGPVLDIKFADGTLPNLMNAIEVKMADKKIVAEVAQHLGDDVVRCIAMSSTDGMSAAPRLWIPVRRSRCRLATRPWAGSSMYWVRS